MRVGIISMEYMFALEKLGLTRIESRIYVSLLDLGPSQAGNISKKTGIHRRNVYDSLDRLSEKGLVSYIINNNRKYFQATDPDRLTEIIKEMEAEVSTIIPSLKELFAKTKSKEETMFYKGIDGLKTAFEDQLKEGKEILILGASPEASEILRFYFKWYTLRRREKKIRMKVIADNGARGKFKIPLSEIRYLGALGPTAINIYADKVAVILWDKERPLAILIKNDKIANSYRSFFEHMWKTAKK